jgi:hypothetical protein
MPDKNRQRSRNRQARPHRTAEALGIPRRQALQATHTQDIAQSSRPRPHPNHHAGKSRMPPKAKHPRNRRRSYKDTPIFCKGYSRIQTKNLGAERLAPKTYGNGGPCFEGVRLGTSVGGASSRLPPKALFTFDRRNQRDLFSPG